ncbi:MAG: DUF1549 domain-containing protein, partial [Planctomycetaceae bacterium]|nr:DUF1549 domain-containing protein [Planctomycetaceae bacterium]
ALAGLLALAAAPCAHELGAGQLRADELCADEPPAAAPTPAAPPALHERIDALIDAAAVGPLAPACSDADFVRRIYLDLTGVIPTADQARGFFADQAADRRQQLIDRLLGSPQYARHMALTWDVMLMERRNDKSIKTPEWQAWLRKAFADNRPLDQLYRDLVATDGADDATRPAARFLLDRDLEPNLLTRDLGRVLFGMDFQCAQCHDHPLIDDYYQADYYGLYAFVLRSSLFTDAKAKKALIGEKADGEASYKSVFTGDAGDNVLPRLPKGATVAIEPYFAKAEQYVSVPAKEVRGVPKYSRRGQLAGLLRESTEFRRNLANRLWAHMFGRGLVHPVDFHYAANPPSHPELLSLLADELAKNNFDARWLLRQLALTRAYQRSCDAPQAAATSLPPAAELIAQLEARRPALVARVEELKGAIASKAAERKALAEQVAKHKAELPMLDTAVAAAREVAGKAATEQKSADETLAKKKDQSQVLADAATKAGEAVAKLPDDKVLAEAAAKIAERSKAVAAEMETATKTAADAAAKTKSTADQATAAQDAFAKAQAAMPTEQWTTLDRALIDAQRQLADANYAVAALDAQIATAKAIGDYQSKQADPASAAPAWDAVIDRWTVGVQLAPLKSLTNEQFAMSLMQATGVLSGQEAASQAAIEKSPPDALKNAAEADRPRVLADLVEQHAFDQLRGNVKAFENLYGTLQGADFQATVNQSLFFGNGGTVLGWVAAGGNRLTGRPAALDDAALTDELYVSVLTRLPTQEEKDDTAAFLKDRASDRPAAIGELVWALVSSNEFRFNH